MASVPTNDLPAEGQWLAGTWAAAVTILERAGGLNASLQAVDRLLAGDEAAWHEIADRAAALRVTSSDARSSLGPAPTPRTAEIYGLVSILLNEAEKVGAGIEDDLEHPERFNLGGCAIALMPVLQLLDACSTRTSALAGEIKRDQQIQSERPTREAIPAAVRREVWQRDQGRCVDCGSKAKLEYDHTLPVSKGGSNTARNIELRCETCNRKKGARI